MDKKTSTKIDPSELLEKLARWREEKLDNVSNREESDQINKDFGSFLDDIVKATNLREFAEMDGAKQVIAKIEEQIVLINSIILLGYDQNGKALEGEDYQSLYDRRSAYKDLLEFFFEPEKVFERYLDLLNNNLVESRDYDKLG